MFVVGERDIFEEANMHVVLEVGMEIEQDKKAIFRRILDVIEDFLGFKNSFARLIGGFERLEAFGDGPAIGFQLKLLANGANHANDLRFFVALDGDEWRARSDDGGKVA